MRRVSPLLFQQHLSSRLPQACTHEDGRSIRNHTNSSLRNHHVGMARYRFYTRAKTLALRPLGVRVVCMYPYGGGTFLSLLSKEDRQLPFLSPYNSLYSITICIRRIISSDVLYNISESTTITLGNALFPTF